MIILIPSRLYIHQCSQGHEQVSIFKVEHVIIMKMMNTSV